MFKIALGAKWDDLLSEKYRESKASTSCLMNLDALEYWCHFLDLYYKFAIISEAHHLVWQPRTNIVQNQSMVEPHWLYLSFLTLCLPCIFEGTNYKFLSFVGTGWTGCLGGNVQKFFPHVFWSFGLFTIPLVPFRIIYFETLLHVYGAQSMSMECCFTELSFTLGSSF